jgi:glycosyltransferase involved in cell wall biosynthesis
MKTILYFVSEDWYFYSHRLPIAKRAVSEGYKVFLLTKSGQFSNKIRCEGIDLISIDIDRSGLNIFKELQTFYEIYKYYKKIKPEIVHHVAMKPVIYGTIVARLIGSIKVVNALAGLGFVFTSKHRKFKLIRKAFLFIFKLIFNHPSCHLILQNNDDLNYFLEKKIIDKDFVSLIRGSGVDINKFLPTQTMNDSVIVMMASRMLWDKGVGEFFDAASILKKYDLNVTFILVGGPDYKNPSTITEDQLLEWSSTGIIEWWGEQIQMHKVLTIADIVCLPSYREGLPKVLLEAASCAKPIIASDVPGCREIVHDQKNGFLIPPADSFSLAEAIKKLVINEEKRLIMGKKSLEIVTESFSESIVVDKTHNLYKKLLQ